MEINYKQIMQVKSFAEFLAYTSVTRRCKGYCCHFWYWRPEMGIKEWFFFFYWNIILIKKYKVSTYFRKNNLAMKIRMGWREWAWSLGRSLGGNTIQRTSTMKVVTVGIRCGTRVEWKIKLMRPGGRWDWVGKGKREVQKNCASDLVDEWGPTS